MRWSGVTVNTSMLTSEIWIDWSKPISGESFRLMMLFASCAEIEVTRVAGSVKSSLGSSHCRSVGSRLAEMKRGWRFEPVPRPLKNLIGKVGGVVMAGWMTGRIAGRRQSSAQHVNCTNVQCCLQQSNVRPLFGHHLVRFVGRVDGDMWSHEALGPLFVGKGARTGGLSPQRWQASGTHCDGLASSSWV